MAIVMRNGNGNGKGNGNVFQKEFPKEFEEQGEVSRRGRQQLAGQPCFAL